MAFVAPPADISPRPGLDPSWHTGLSLAGTNGLRFGSQLSFTYGPLGFLDFPLELSRRQLLLGTIFAVVATAAAWLAFYYLFRRAVREPAAAIAATVVLVLASQLTTMSSVLMVAAAAAALDHVGRPAWQRPWLPAAVAMCAALLVPVRFSVGLGLTGVAVVCVLFSAERRLRRIIEAALSWVLVTGVVWLLAGQSLPDYPRFVRNSLDLSRGYADAMALESKPNVLQYVLMFLVTAFVVLLLIRDARQRPLTVTVAVALIAAVLLYLGFREAAGRHGPGHQNQFYLYSLPVLGYMLTGQVQPVARWQRFPMRAGVFVLVLLLTGARWLPAEPDDAVSRWGAQLQVLVDTKYQRQQLAAARAAAQQTYRLSSDMQAELAGRPVTVDSFETTLIWAYSLTWHPAPVFQTYAAYTAGLDQRNADAIATASPRQAIVRSSVGTIDGRNPLWDSPRYTVAELCNYRRISADAHWLVLHKAADRCGAPQRLSSTRVTAGQTVTVPPVGSDQLLVMSFAGNSPGPLVALGRLLDKSFHPLTVTAGNYPFRLPRALADGPLLLNAPADSGWPAAFLSGSPYGRVSFSEPGTVTFSAIPFGR